MPKLRLTGAAVDRFQPPSSGQVEYYDTHLPGFGLRMSYSGAKAWFVMTRVDRKLTRVTLGHHPALSLADARTKARLVVEHARGGGDPRRLRAEERQRKEKDRSTTFGLVAAAFMERHVDRKLRPSTAREYRRLLTGPDTQGWRSRAITSLTKQDVLEVLAGMEQRGAPAAADRALSYLSKFFNWCLDEEVIQSSPTARVRPSSSPQSRDRVLSTEELASVWAALEDYPAPFGPLFKVLLLTGQRRGEVAGMRWSELRGLGEANAIWDLPAERTKNGQPHLVPLTPAVQAILVEQPRSSELLFTTTSSTAVSGFSKAKRLLDQQVGKQRASAGLGPMPAWTLHDLRRTMVTGMNEQLGIQPHIVEAVVNHTTGAAKRGIAGIYNRALYLQDRKDALERWAQLVELNGAP